MNEQTQLDARRALSLMPCGIFVMTAMFEGKRGGVRVRSVAPCADEPLLISVAAWKGHGIEPLIRDSHHFAVCQIDAEDRLLLKKFSGHLSDHADQFDSVATERLVSGAPVLKRSILAIDCEVVRHFDMEADNELYIGLVLGSRVYAQTNGHAPHGKSNPGASGA